MIKTEKKTVKGCKIVYTSKYTKDFDILLSCNDSLEFVKQIPTNSVSLVVSSPPYNIGKSYEKKIDLEKYLEEQKKVLTECVRILKLNGSLCWEVGNFVDKSEIFRHSYDPQVVKRIWGFHNIMKPVIERLGSDAS